MNFKRGKGVPAQVRPNILNVCLFFHNEKLYFERWVGETPFNAAKKICDATDVSKSTVMNIRKEAEAGELK